MEEINGVGEFKPLWKIFNEWKSLTGVGEFKPLLKIFNEWKSLTVVGELNPYWRSSMNGRV